MSEITPFVSRIDHSAEANLKAFIESVRQGPNPFGEHIRFEENVWDVTGTRMASGLGRQRITFSTLESAASKSPILFRVDFLNFAKAYIVHRQSLIPSRNSQHRLSALRAVDLVLRKFEVEIIHIRADHLDHVAKIIGDHFSAEGAYRIANQVELLSEFLCEARLISAPFQWRNSIPRPLGTVRVGPQHAANRAKKLPSGTALEALALAFRRAVHPSDRLIAATAALLCSAPVRIGEVLRMRADCEVEDCTAAGTPAYGLRWWTEKGVDPEVRWVLPVMVPTARAAVAILREVTSEARRIAGWYAKHPSEIYLPAQLAHLRGADFIPLAAADQLLGLVAEKWAERRGLKVVQVAGQPQFAFLEFERSVLIDIPDGFPIFDKATKLHASDAMFLVQFNEFRTDRGTSSCMIEGVTQRQISDGLGARAKHGTASMFSRLGLANEDGSPIKMTTHSFRHYLNTLAQRGAADPLDIAKWSGRSSPRQNAVYDHVSADELLDDLEMAVGGDVSPLKMQPPASLEEFSALSTGAAHVTEYGFCLHDFAMLPCQLHRDCLSCEEHVCVKGDKKKEMALEKVLNISRDLLNRSEDAADQGYEGVDRWKDHQLRTVERVEQILAIMRDPDLPIGTVIRAAPERVGERLPSGSQKLST